MKKSLFLAMIVFIVSFASALKPLHAAAPETPPQGIQSFLDSIRALEFPIMNPAAHEQKLAKTDAYLDLPSMGRKALGENWTQMTADQQNTFTELLWRLIENIAFPRTKDFLGDQKISYEQPKPLAKGFEVSSMVKDQEAALDVPVVYNLADENGQWKIYDIFMDGISMTEDLKFQFDKIIKEGGFSGLLTRMSERLDKARKETAGP